MRRTLSAVSLVAFAGAAASAQVLYNNGPFATGPTTLSGVAAPAGFVWSEVANDSPTTSNTSAGSTVSVSGTTGAFRLADDFTIPAGENWTVNGFTTYGYQTGSAPTATPITGGTLNIWNGRPGDVGSSIIGTATFGAMSNTNVFRTFNSVAPPPGSAPGTTRLVRQVDWNVAGGINLGAGTYWIDYQYTGSGTFFNPTVTIPGVRTIAGWNARQLVTTGLWADALDTGNPASIPDVAQDFPFLVNGVPPPGTLAMLGLGALVAGRRRRS